MLDPPAGYQLSGLSGVPPVVVAQYTPIICRACGRKQPTRYYPQRCLFGDCASNQEHSHA